MKDQSELDDPEEIRLHNIIDMGLTFSAMIRLFEKGSKKKLPKHIRIISLENIINTTAEGKPQKAM